jgi:hypothetical protein
MCMISRRMWKLPHYSLKGKVPRDFGLHIFFMNLFPQAPNYPIRAISNFLRKFSEILPGQGTLPGVDVKCQMCQVSNEKIFNQKSFNYFVWTPLDSRVNI